MAMVGSPIWQGFDAVHISGCTSKLLESHYRPVNGFQIAAEDRFFRDASLIASRERSALLLYNFTTNCLEGCWQALGVHDGQVQWATLERFPSVPFSVFKAVLADKTRLPPAIPLKLSGNDAHALLQLMFEYSAGVRGTPIDISLYVSAPPQQPRASPAPYPQQAQLPTYFPPQPQQQPQQQHQPSAPVPVQQQPQAVPRPFVPPSANVQRDVALSQVFPWMRATPAAAAAAPTPQPPPATPATATAYQPTATPQAAPGIVPPAVPPPAPAAGAPAAAAAAGASKHMCPLCCVRKADYINVACRHLGPCETCCPDAANNWQQTYPRCSICNGESSRLHRVRF